MTTTNSLLNTLFIAWIVSVVAIPCLAIISRLVGLVDIPDDRRQHEGNVPLIGGLAIILAITASIGMPMTGSLYGMLAIAALPIVIVGIIDDRWRIRARHRFIAQLLSSLVVVYSTGLYVDDLSATFGPFTAELGSLAIPFTLVAVTGVINAFNMSDGLDGLCAGYSLITLCLLVTVHTDFFSQWPSDGPGSALDITIALIGALGGFLVYNIRILRLRKASAFLGDHGSMLLGFAIAWLVIHATQGAEDIRPVTALWLIALPLIDLFSCFVRRLSEGLTPMTADRRHLHHLLLARGMSSNQAVETCLALGAAFGIIGIVSAPLRVQDHLMFWALIVVFSLYTHYAVRFWRPLQLPAQAGDRVSAATNR